MIYFNAIYAIYFKVHRLDPNNKEIQPILVRLHKAVSKKVNIRDIVEGGRRDGAHISFYSDHFFFFQF